MKQEFLDQHVDGAALTITDGCVMEMSMNHCAVSLVGRENGAQLLNAKTKPRRMDYAAIITKCSAGEMIQRLSKFVILPSKNVFAPSKSKKWEGPVHCIANFAGVLLVDEEIKRKLEFVLITITRREKHVVGFVIDATKCWVWFMTTSTC